MPRNAIKPFPELSPQHGPMGRSQEPAPLVLVCQRGPPPQDNSPNLGPPKSHPLPIFCPQQTQPSSAASREELQQRDLAFRLLPSCKIWFALNQSKQTAAEAGGAPGPPDPPTLPAHHRRRCCHGLWARCSNSGTAKTRGFGGLGQAPSSSPSAAFTTERGLSAVAGRQVPGKVKGLICH